MATTSTFTIFYQRRKRRDLFDLAALETTKVDPARIVEAFLEYMNHESHHVTRTQFERNLANKFRNAQSVADIGPLLAASYKWDREKPKAGN